MTAKYIDEPTITTAAQLQSPGFMEETTLAEAVANGRLFILNGRGEYEQVILADWWKENLETGGESLLTICSEGYEYNEDGDETRRWREVQR